MTHIAGIYKGSGREEEAQEACRVALEAIAKHLDLHPDDARAYYLGACAHGMLGDGEKALEWAGRALVMGPAEPSVLYNVACLYSLQGKLEEAIDCLEKAVANGFAHKEWIENDTDFAPLRDSPRYMELLSGM
ncbi:MAG: tetratricopeptide repeat protein [Planctomycetota bacterium]|jgi:Flp pilus assembly protein TadD